MNPLSKLGPLDHTRNARPQRTRKRAARLERKYAPHRYFPRLEQLENRVVPALTGSTFESNDGNLIVNTSGNKDWVNAPEFKFGVDLPSGQTDNSFGQGTKEDSAVPTVVTGSIPNNKSDLTRFYVSSETGTNDHIFMYLAWERANTLGTANMDFEFNQSTALSANGVTPVRTAGDMLITFDFASGGNVVNLGLRRWTGSAWDAGTDLTAGGIAEGAVNDLTTVVDPMTGKTLAKDTFGEAALDLTAAGVFPANQCVHFGRAYLKSRSSTSFTAEMKDFIPPIAVNIDNCPNISVTKTADAAVINTGDVAGFTIIVSNDSVGVARNVTLNDPLPAGINWQIVSGPGSITNGVLTASLGDLAGGATVAIHVTGLTDAADCGTLTNTVTVAASNEEADDLDDNTATATITVQCPDIHVAKTVGETGETTGTINAGENAVFTIVVSNAGPGAAYGVTVNDTLPAGVTWSTDLAGAQISNGVLTASLGTLASGASVTFHISGATDPNEIGLHTDGCKLRNSVTVAATNEDADDQGNNSAAAIILVDPVLTPDDTTFLSNQPVIVPPPPTATSSASFEIEGNLVVDTFGNLDWANAPDLQIGIDLPTGQTDDSFGQGTKENSAVPTAVTGSVPNNKSDLTRFYVASNISMNGDIFVYLGWERANTLGTANIDFEFNQSDVPSSNGVTPVRTVGDMLITFDFASGGNVVNLGLRRWTGSAWGPSIDLTAAGFAIGAVNDPAFGQTTVLDPITGQTLAQDTFGEASINLTAARVFTSDVCVHFGSAYVKSRSSTSFTAEMKDFIAPIGVNINNCPDVHVRKTVGDTGRTTGTVTAGDPVSFTLVVSNDGAGTATNVTLTDTLPAGVTWTEDSPYATIVNGVLTASFGDMASGASFTIHVRGGTDINSCGKLRNEAFVAADNEPDDDQTDNRGAAIILVNPVLTADDISFLNGGGSPMLAAALGSGAGTEGVTDEMLQSIVTQAINHWRATGVTQEQLAALETQTIYIVNLPYGELGWTRGNATWIDRTAQGWGWSVTGAPDRMDLLTVVTHELGHVLGLPPTATGLMEVYLMPGVRLVPAAVLSTGNVAVVAASTGDSGGSAGATANNLPAGLVVEEFGVGVRSESLATASTDSLDAAFATVVDPGVTLAGPRTGEAVPSALPAAASVAQTGGSTHRGLTATVNVVPDGSGTQRELTAVLSERSPQAALPVATLLPSAFRGLDQGFAAVLLPSRGPSSSAVEPGSNGVPADEPEEAEAAGWPLARENSAPARLQWAVAAQAEARWQQLAGDACFADGSWALGGSDGDVPVSTGIVAEARPGSDSAIALAALVVAMGGLSWRVDDAESEPRRRRSLR